MNTDEPLLIKPEHRRVYEVLSPEWQERLLESSPEAVERFLELQLEVERMEADIARMKEEYERCRKEQYDQWWPSLWFYQKWYYWLDYYLIYFLSLIVRLKRRVESH